MATNSFFTQGTTGEQDLVGSLVTEQIKMFGKGCLLYTSHFS